MVDYVNAFKQGLEAADAAEAAKQEIADVFADLDSQIRKVTNEKIGLKIKEVQDISSALSNLGNMFSRQDIKYDHYIVAYNPSIPNSPVKQLAEWTEDRAGFPCKISLAENYYICEDRKALETSLAKLLRDPIVGETLYVLMRLEPDESSTESDD